MRRRLTIVGAFLRRDFTTALSYRLPYAFDLFAVLVNVVLFFYVGKLIDPGASDSRDLADGYFPFVLVGLGMFGMASVALSRFSAGIRDEQVAGTLEVLLMQPVSPRLVILGSAAYELTRAVVTAFLTVILGVLIFDVALTTEPVALLAALAVTLVAMVVFTALGVAVAAFTLLYKQGQSVVAATIVTISLLSGVYYPLDVMPGALSAIGELLPTTWALDLLRDCLIHGEVDAPALLGLAAVAALALPVGLWIFSRALDRARALGTLGQY